MTQNSERISTGKVPIIVRWPYYLVYLELVTPANDIFIHTDVRKWTPAAANHMKNVDWPQIQEHLAPLPIHALHSPKDHEDPEKHKKYLRWLGFVFLRNDRLPDRSKCEIWVKRTTKAEPTALMRK